MQTSQIIHAAKAKAGSASCYKIHVHAQSVTTELQYTCSHWELCKSKAHNQSRLHSATNCKEVYGVPNRLDSSGQIGMASQNEGMGKQTFSACFMHANW